LDAQSQSKENTSVAASTAFVMTDKTLGGKCNLKIKEMLNRMIDILNHVGLRGASHNKQRSVA